MLLIFGFKPVIEVLGALVYACDVCTRVASHQIVKQRQKFTLFFVPLFSVGGARYYDVCEMCGRQREISQSDAERALMAAPVNPQPAYPPVPATPQDAPAWPPQDR